MAQNTKSTTTKKARALLDCEIGGRWYKINSLVEASASVIDSAEKAGKVDTSAAAVSRAVAPAEE